MYALIIALFSAGLRLVHVSLPNLPFYTRIVIV